MNLKKLKKSLVLQQDQSDCGVACLLTLIRYYGGASSLEALRELSGTSQTGTTLLGLYQVANQVGFTAEGCEADIPALIQHGKPVMLHLTLENGMQHYVVASPQPSPKERDQKTSLSTGEWQGVRFVVADPARGVIEYTSEDLAKVWISKKCLTLEPDQHFVSAKQIRQNKQKWLWDLVQADLNLLGVSLVLGILIAVLGLVMSIFSQRLIDDILPSGNQKKLIMGIVLVFLLLLIRLGLGALRQFLLNKQVQDFNNRLIDNFYSKLLFLPKSFFDTRKIGELTARLNDAQRIQRVISQLSGSLVIDLLVLIISLVFLFIYVWQIGVLALLSLPLFFGLLYRFQVPIISAQKNVMSAYARTESNYIDTMQGISEIKNHNQQAFFAQQNQVIYGAFQSQVFQLGKINIRLNFMAGLISIVFLSLVLAYSSYLVLGKQIKVGELMAILGISSNLLPSVLNLALISIPFNEARVAFDRMLDFVNIEPESPPAPKGGEKDEVTEKSSFGGFSGLEIKNLSFRFAGRQALLKNIDLMIKKGEMVAILGESGSGKSTLLQIIQKFYTPFNGEILINNNIQLIDIQHYKWRNLIGVVPQQIKLFSTNLINNICVGEVPENHQSVIDFCKNYGFDVYFSNFPQGYATILGEGGVNLSGGQQQLVALARALYKQPQLLLLDEPTSAMDKQTANFVMNLLAQLNPKMGILMITHQLSLAEKAKRVYKLNNGQMIFQKTLTI